MDWIESHAGLWSLLSLAITLISAPFVISLWKRFKIKPQLELRVIGQAFPRHIDMDIKNVTTQAIRVEEFTCELNTKEPFQPMTKPPFTIGPMDLGFEKICSNLPGTKPEYKELIVNVKFAFIGGKSFERTIRMPISEAGVTEGGFIVAP